MRARRTCVAGVSSPLPQVAAAEAIPLARLVWTRWEERVVASKWRRMGSVQRVMKVSVKRWQVGDVTAPGKIAPRVHLMRVYC